MSRRLLLALALLVATPLLHAHPLVQMRIVDATDGTTLPQWEAGTRHWITGQPGHRYAVRLANLTGQRLLVVLSVDGINAVTGQTADPGQRGYVLAPWQSIEVDGWRKSLQDVAQFVFTDLEDSYAARTGRPGNTGVIGIAVFKERRETPPQIALVPVLEEAGSDRASAAPADKARQSLGTGHGPRVASPATHTSFIRASVVPAQRVEVRYDSPERIIGQGILRPPRAGSTTEPEAFPQHYVPDP